ncbi:MAG: hypothetical protein CSA62_03520 [Planctomycetota bacterium]|nr:MAG: hypothetical protein CSA62_03520 [Planctomycetota bacterium]
MKLKSIHLLAALGLSLLLGVTACDGSSTSATTGSANEGGVRAKLTGVEYGRLVDIYAYRRVDPKNSDRLLASNRRPVLIEREVLINPDIRNEDLFASKLSQYRFLPYDPKTGHRELLILWDDQDATESESFKRALTHAKSGLKRLGSFSAFRTVGGNTVPPVLPYDSAIQLVFDRALGLDSEYFRANPTAVQVLRLAGNPDLVVPSQAYSPVNVRVLSKENGKRLIIDSEISGNEANGRNPNPFGLPLSRDSVQANLRIALPTAGVLAGVFRLSPDENGAFNGVGVRGEAALIRDFRVANASDDNAGGLRSVDKPELVAYKVMGLMAIDRSKRVLTINKRYANLVIRGRYPFVDGPLSKTSGLPLGPRAVPQGNAFQSGDMIFQDVPLANGEVVRVKAEVLRNLDIPVTEGDPKLAVGGGLPVARLEVSSISAFDSRGNEVFFTPNTLPLGADVEVKVHYHNTIKVQKGVTEVGDSSAGRLAEFMSFDPAPPRLDPVTRKPLAANEWIDPMASVALRFSKPMALETVNTEDNVVVANSYAPEMKWVRHVKVGNMTVIPSHKNDLYNDGTGVRLSMPMGLLHQKGSEESYFLHLIDGAKGPLDRGGRSLELSSGQQGEFARSFKFTMRKDADDNTIGNLLCRFNSPDEDGSSDQSNLTDYFGQFQVRDGRVYGVPTTRFSKVADGTTLPFVRPNPMFSRECEDSGKKVAACRRNPGCPLYQTPRNMFQIQGVWHGGISEPHVGDGCRLQMTYREDDLGLSHLEPIHFEIDVEQLHWSPFVPRTPSRVTFDIFDRYTLTLGTSEKRPDKRPVVVAGQQKCCGVDGNSFRSGLMTNFEANYLDGAARVDVVKDQMYTINPNNAFLSSTNETFVGYPKFQRTYTWRDRRYVGWNEKTQTPTGLGGAQKPGDPGNSDTTKDITSPFFPEFKPDADGYNAKQRDDFDGTQKEDHHPYALPLLVDFRVYPDDSSNGKVKGDNLFQLALVGPIPPAPGHGFYNPGFPWFRVHSTGGRDLQGVLQKVDPLNSTTAKGGWVDNSFLGRFKAPPGDDHLYWAQADFVRKTSVLTFGYRDLLMPAKNDVTGVVGWPGGADRNGLPNFASLDPELRPSEFAIIMRPSPEKLPEGTKVLVEYRGSESFLNDDKIYAGITPSAGMRAKDFGNLLNPNFACEQYRYAGSARVASQGVTAYKNKANKLVSTRTGVAPRFLNWRVTFINNTNVTPALVPYLDTFAVIYRLKKPHN